MKFNNYRCGKRVFYNSAIWGGIAFSLLYGKVHAAPVEWTVNGHWYEVITTPGGINWDNAQAAAVAVGGYLATLTTNAENSFAFALADAAPSAWIIVGGPFGEVGGPWLGGFQPDGSPEPGGNWTWNNGEGLFTTAGYNTNWISGSPNNFGAGGENRNQFYGLNLQRTAKWNDNLNTRLMNGYVIEWNSSPVPEPQTWALLFSGLLVVRAVRRARSVAFYKSPC
jgi:hypothetical protein